jgi:hypothetical protein
MAFSACGDDDDDDADSSPSSNAPVDLCALLTSAEVSEALGESVVEVVEEHSEPIFGCYWRTEADLQGADFATVQLLDGANEVIYGLTAGAEEISGLGQRAQYSDLVGLEVLTSDYYVNVQVSHPDLDEAATREQTLALGQLVIQRLGD